jgi:multiple antibiotic resistance protein
MDNILGTTLYLLALVNPVSKIFLLSAFSKGMRDEELKRLCIFSSCVGLGILLTFAAAGSIILTHIFHMELHSFQIVGGVVLFTIGFNALTRGSFFELDEKQKLAEMSIVPLASPMIAGPATITAAVSFSAQYGLAITALAITLAVAGNFLIMLSSRMIGQWLTRYNLMGALIRITGLIVGTIAMQMVLDGLRGWLKSLS